MKTFHIEIAVLAMMVLGGTFLSGNEAEGIGIEQLVVPIPTSEQSMTPDGTESIEIERLYGVFKYKELFCPPELYTTPEGKQYHVFTKARICVTGRGKGIPMTTMNLLSFSKTASASDGVSLKIRYTQHWK